MRNLKQNNKILFSDNDNKIMYETYSNILCSFDDPDDIYCAPQRLKIFSHSVNAKLPVIFRHYERIPYNGNEFSAPPMMKQSYCTLFIFAKHNARMMINNNVYIPDLGSVVLIKAGDVYQPIFLPRERTDYYEINFPEDFFQLVESDSPFHELFHSKEIHSIISPTHEATLAIFHILEKILKTLSLNQAHKQFLVWSHLIQLASHICYIISNKSVPRDNQIINHSLHKAMDYISSNYLTINGISDVSKHCHVSNSYLCRIFKKQINSTPIEFVNHRKIYHAKYLLKKGSSVTEACYSSGFNNYPYFIRLFKKITGQTPTEYAKNKNSTE